MMKLKNSQFGDKAPLFRDPYSNIYSNIRLLYSVSQMHIRILACIFEYTNTGIQSNSQLVSHLIMENLIYTSNMFHNITCIIKHIEFIQVSVISCIFRT